MNLSTNFKCWGESQNVFQKFIVAYRNTLWMKKQAGTGVRAKER